MHKLQAVVPQDNYKIKAIFTDGKVVLYEVNQLLDTIPAFRIWRNDEMLFQSVDISSEGDMICWNEYLNLDAEMVYTAGVLLEAPKEIQRLIIC